ncbi:MAG: hypothetical protein NZM35_04960 [Chitinophagales bacterium]|nr:hypothetical protein [Chitinophagales bacterium]MDW8418573.1 hypothetical protein [Chitinophagales bacterium]
MIQKRFLSVTVCAGILAFILTSLMCHTSTSVKQGDIYIGEQTIIYKTTKDYSHYVPVTMNSDKTEIVAYPSPSDLYRNGKLALPTPLHGGFWLDNRGIGPNSVFLNITYENYAKLSAAPSLQSMMGMIIDKNPFTAIYNLGNRSRFRNEVKEINKIIRKKQLDNYKKIL